MHTGNRARRVMARLAPVLVIALVVAACSGGSSSGIKTSGAWARNAPKTAGAGAAYVVIENTGTAADALVGARSDVATSTEVHETYAIEPEAPMASGMPAASMGTGAMMGMRPVARVELPAGGKLELKPGSYHVMLIDLTRELKAGDKVEITLVFEKAGDVKVTAEVRAE